MATLSLSTPEGFEQLMSALTSRDNATRQAAEDTYASLKETPDALAQHLIRALRQSQHDDVRSMCAIMLRRTLVVEALWPKLSAHVQGLLKAEILNSLKEEALVPVQRKVCDTVSDLASSLMTEQSGWNELLPFMMTCIQSQNARLMEMALLVFANLGDVVSQLAAYLPTLHDVFKHTLQHQAGDVRVAALKAATTFIRDLESSSDRNKLQDLVPEMLQTMVSALEGKDENAAQEALEMFISIAESYPRFLRRQLEQVLALMLRIARTTELEESTRSLAAEFVVTLCEAREKASGMMRKLPQHLQDLFQCLVQFLLDVEDCPEWHSGESEATENEGEGDLFEIGQECLDRVALALGGNTVFPLAAQLLPGLMQSSNWRERHAALICLAQIAEGCTKTMLKSLGDLTRLCMAGLQDPHAKVRWAACQALGQMCTDLGPNIQEEQHQNILPGLMAVMDDFGEPRVQAHASAAIVNFTEGCESDLLPNYLDQLIQKLLQLAGKGAKTVKEGALTALASVADASKNYFINYYDHVMPLLRGILSSGVSREEALLRAKALECISLVGMAVGKERFREDAHRVMELIRQLQSVNLAADDPTNSYMLSAGARICKCLGQEFLPYLSIVMPPLLHSAQLKPDVEVKGSSEDSDEEEDDDEHETLYLGEKRIRIRTSVLEEKATACNMLCCYADELKEGFFPYVEEVTGLMVSLLTFYFHEDVRDAAVQALPELLTCAKAAADKGMANASPQYVKQMLDYIWDKLMEAMQREPDHSVLHSMLNTIEQIVKLLAPDLMSLQQIQQAFDRWKVVLSDSSKRRRERAERQQQEDWDQEEEEAVQLENEEEEELITAVADGLTSVLEAYLDTALPLLEGLMQEIGVLVRPEASVEEKRIGVCIMDDVLEYSAEGSAKFGGSICPLLLENSKAQDCGLRQCAVYGLGMLAQHRQHIFQPIAAEAVQCMVTMIQSPDGRSEPNAAATENAVAALGRVLAYSAGTLPDQGAQLAELWLHALPLTEDKQEAEGQHALLVEFLDRSDVRILGPGNKNLGKLVEVMVLVLAGSNDLSTHDTRQRMALLLKQMQVSVPPQIFQDIVGKLKPRERKQLDSALSA
eukprot:jgi/Astpho2/2388/Aster-05646